MSVIAACELGREHRRQLERLLVDVTRARRPPKQSETLYASYVARIHVEQAVWIDGLTQLSDALFDLLDVDGAVAYAMANWRPLVPVSAARGMWRTIRKEQPPEGWQSPNADELAARLAAQQAAAAEQAAAMHEMWILGALQVYLGMAMQTSQEAGNISLRQLGQGKTWEWANPRVMARDLYAVRGSKVIQQMYGNHIDKLRDIILRATDPRNPRTLAQVRAEIGTQWPKLQKYQISRIARTETAVLWTHTSMSAYAANGVEQWESTVAHGPSIGIEQDDPCDECIAEALYVHEISDDWPPWHPNCACEAVPLFAGEDGDVWLPPDEPWGGGAAAGEEAAIIEYTEAASALRPTGGGPILSPAPLPGERMAMTPSRALGRQQPYRDPRRGNLGLGPTRTPEGDLRAQITSCGNKISGLKTRLKREEALLREGGGSSAKVAEIQERLSDLYRLRAELKGRLGGPTPPPPPLPPPRIPGDPFKLDDTAESFEGVLNWYKGHDVRISFEGHAIEGKLVFEDGYWLIEGRTIGNGRGVLKIEVRDPATKDWWTVAAKPEAPVLRLPEKPITLQGTDESTLQVMRNIEGHEADLWYRNGEKVSGMVTHDGRDFILTAVEGPPSVRALIRPDLIIRVDVRVIQDGVIRRVTIARSEMQTVQELQAALTSVGNKLSGLKTRLKRELAGAGERPSASARISVINDISNRIRLLEAERERLRTLIVEAKQRPSLPPEVPIAPLDLPPVSPGLPSTAEQIAARNYLERGPGSTPLADEMATFRAQLMKDIAKGGDEGGLAAVRTTIAAGERVQVELNAQGLKYLDEAIARASSDFAAADARFLDARDAMAALERKFNYTMTPGRHQMARDTYGKSYNDLTWAQRIDIDRAVLNGSAEARAAEEALALAGNVRGSLSKAKDEYQAAIKRAEEEKIVAEREALIKVFEQVRDMGPSVGARLEYVVKTGTDSKIYYKGKLKARSAAKTMKVLESAQKFFPRAWLRAQRPADIGWVKRGYHGGRYEWQEIRISGGDRSKVTGDVDGLATGIHEMGHEVEDTVVAVQQLQAWFYTMRTRGEELVQLRKVAPRGRYDADELTREDKFSNPYMGKYYDGKSYEVVTMGMESIWTKSFELDAEYRAFMLGLQALV